ncbi:unnamed protein product [Spirodela intermedia]|uniref:Uncharacterized protein n=1 Tax=Spirodela intermedia TaxID=51605 RepID=A0A7I8J7K9_SPIIN|nr:unnamed protein product [Spirodela intermedia]CAA6666030.1 unnamed protein product [Spirodela intermedia]
MSHHQYVLKRTHTFYSNIKGSYMANKSSC